MTIFISLAAYRDPELVPTIEDCIAKARWPEKLRFGVCWQHDPDSDEAHTLDKFRDDPRFRIDMVDHRESDGICWARDRCMKLYDGEDWFLQLDSHHRFAQDWDALVIHQAQLSGSAKPVLSAYCPAYTPGQELPVAIGAPLPSWSQPTRIVMGSFTPEGIPLPQGVLLENWWERRQPAPGAHVCGHFVFSLGTFVEEVPYDPMLYYQGEEITLSVRAFTWGYDIFHPFGAIVWHEYFGPNRRKHWDDHTGAAGTGKAWFLRDRYSKERTAKFLIEPYEGRLGTGPHRTVAEYEEFAGIDFRARTVRPGGLLDPPALVDATA